MGWTLQRVADEWDALPRGERPDILAYAVTKKSGMRTQDDRREFLLGALEDLERNGVRGFYDSHSRRQFNSLPQQFDVYRGAIDEEIVPGLHWSLDLYIAAFVAIRGTTERPRTANEVPMIWHGRVRRDDVRLVALTECEVVLHPAKVEIVARAYPAGLDLGRPSSVAKALEWHPCSLRNQQCAREARVGSVARDGLTMAEVS